MTASFLQKLKTQLVPSAYAEGSGSVTGPITVNAERSSKIRELILGAKKEIYLLSSKINSESDPENNLYRALEDLNQSADAAAAKAENKAIKVRILINRKSQLVSLFHTQNSENIFRKLTQENFPNLDFQYAEHYQLGFGIYHAKLLMVDDKTVVSSCDYQWQHNSNKEGWIDLSTVIEGGISYGFKQFFVNAWNSSTVRALSRKKDPLVPLEKEPESGEKTLLVLTKKENGNYFSRSQEGPLITAVGMAIREAKRRVDISTPNLNIPAIIRDIADAVERGVEVNILLPKYQNENEENKPRMGGSNLRSIAKLYRLLDKKQCGRMKKLTVRWVTNEDGEVVENRAPGTLHAKFVCADDIVLQGSSPLDIQAQYHSQECDVVIENAKVAQDYRTKFFDPNFNRGVEFHHQALETKTLQDYLKETLGDTTVNVGEFLDGLYVQWVEAQVLSSLRENATRLYAKKGGFLADSGLDKAWLCNEAAEVIKNMFLRTLKEAPHETPLKLQQTIQEKLTTIIQSFSERKEVKAHRNLADYFKILLGVVLGSPFLLSTTYRSCLFHAKTERIANKIRHAVETLPPMNG